jgi:hypothetical protein
LSGQRLRDNPNSTQPTSTTISGRQWARDKPPRSSSNRAASRSNRPSLGPRPTRYHSCRCGDRLIFVPPLAPPVFPIRIAGKSHLDNRVGAEGIRTYSPREAQDHVVFAIRMLRRILTTCGPVAPPPTPTGRMSMRPTELRPCGWGSARTPAGGLSIFGQSARCTPYLRPEHCAALAAAPPSVEAPSGPPDAGDQGQDAKRGDRTAVGQPEHKEKPNDTSNRSAFVLDRQLKFLSPSCSPQSSYAMS